MKLIEDKVPFDFLKDLLKNKASLDNIKVKIFDRLIAYIVYGIKYDQAQRRCGTNVRSSGHVRISEQTTTCTIRKC